MQVISLVTSLAFELFQFILIYATTYDDQTRTAYSKCDLTSKQILYKAI